jgi:hypothetical protein
MQHRTGRSRIYNGVVNAKATVDLIIVDVLEGLPVPTMSAPANVSAESFLKAVFVFAEDYLKDDGAIIVIHPYQVSESPPLWGIVLNTALRLVRSGCA